jgi:hypothetical protein
MIAQIQSHASANLACNSAIHADNLHAMSLTETIIADIERRTAQINLPVKTILEAVGIDWSTWWRWKQAKTSPTVASLMKITRELERRETTTE